MNKFLIILLLLVFTSIKGFTNESLLFPIYTDGKGGYINSKGETIIEPHFDEVKEFSEGLAAVRVADKWGYINSSGNFEIRPKFLWTKHFSDGLALIFYDRKFGYIDKTGKVVIPTKFEQADSFYEDIARVKMNGKWEFIGKDGKVAIATNFDYIESFHSGFAVVAKVFDDKDVRVSYIDKTGKLSSIGWLTYAGRFSENLAIISKDENILPTINRNGLDFNNFDYKSSRVKEIQFEVIDSSMAKVFVKTFNYFNGFSEGLASACLNGKCGYIDIKGNKVINFRFDSVDDFSEGLAQVKINDENFIINKSGEIVFKTGGTVTNPFRNGLAKIISCKEIFCEIRYVDFLGKTVWEGRIPKYDYK